MRRKDTESRISPVLLASVIGLAAAPATYAQSCCASQDASKTAGCSMGGMAATCSAEEHGATAKANSATRAVFMQPVQAVYDNYITVQAALAQDSLKGVATAAAAMAKGIQGDSMKMLPLRVAQQAEALAKAKDVATARDAFKSLSDSLIQYMTEQKVPAGSYYIAYCPMAKASWLQTDKTIMNPYMGKGMIHCGQIKG